jgi:hypothetical protein
VFGASQGLALPRGSFSIGRWVLGNAVGWAVGLPASFGADQENWLSRVLFWAGGGPLGGLYVGTGTGAALAFEAWSKPQSRQLERNGPPSPHSPDRQQPSRRCDKNQSEHKGPRTTGA